MPTLEVKDLSVEYGSGGYLVKPFVDLSFTINDGQLVVLLGPSGSGKTTLLSCLAGLLKPTHGSVRLDGMEITELEGAALANYRRQTVGIAFQSFNLIPSLTAAENVMAALNANGVRGAEAHERTKARLAEVNLSERASHRPGKMSGGQQQRVAIARALANDPLLLLADEPTAHLDYIQVEEIVRVIRELAKPGRLVLVATHDARLMPLADAVIDLSRLPQLEVADEEVKLKAGEVLFEEGKRGTLVYAVERGRVGIFRLREDGTEEQLDTVTKGQYFGELAPMLGSPRSATARATTAATVRSYTLAEFRKLQGVGKKPGAAAAKAKPSTTVKKAKKQTRSTRR